MHSGSVFNCQFLSWISGGGKKALFKTQTTLRELINSDECHYGKLRKNELWLTNLNTITTSTFSIFHFLLLSISFWKKDEKKKWKISKASKSWFAPIDYFAFILDFKNYSFITNFWLSFHLALSFQGYSVVLWISRKNNQYSVKQLNWSKVSQALKQWSLHFETAGLWIFLTRIS